MRQDDVLVKWTGSKRIQAPQIIKHFPNDIQTYYEPFVGGGSMLYVLLCSEVSVKRYRCSDSNIHLINLWNMIKSTPLKLFDFYCEWWPFTKSKYSDLRDQFNQDGDPKKFFCLLRNCHQGLVRFNCNQEFNSGFHPKRRGIRPSRLKTVIDDWHMKLNEKNVRFHVADYREIKPKQKDFMYLDPPYETNQKFYFGDFECSLLWDWLVKQKTRWSLSFNESIPDHLYEKHIMIKNSLTNLDQLKGRKILSDDNLYIHMEV